MITKVPTVAEAYIRTTNDGDAAGFIDCFSDDAIVNDAGREIRGRSAIQAWSQHDIFDVQVNFEVIDVVARDGETVMTLKIDGNFDRTGLPDPLVMNSHLTIEGDKITKLVIRFAED